MSKLSTTKICVKSPAKINLHLEIIGKRKDGYHELAMIMQNIDLSDYIEFENNQIGEIKLKSNSKDLSLDEDNLIIKAANYIKDMSKNKELGANIFLKKNIPIGAGLAGGSSNAAATLVGLNKLWDLDLDYETIFILSAKLGSDVPFFIEGGCQFCFGRGEILEKYSSNFDFGVILLKNPNISISTVDTYKKYSQEFCPKYFTETEKTNKIRNDLRVNGFNDFKLSEQRINVKNDLQVIVERENNSVKKALYLLSNLQNCLSYSMSGSGPTCFALFKDINIANEVFEQNYKMFNNNGFEAWVCKLINSGITLL
ncbi:Putative 4-diphosphocytidyl-2C-methyl-D-erythritol kinase (CMK) [Prochlorococcus marinus subsp. pastoris str. CCMP1986]|uniref:4-diphosphocytidyl-2-C-methyl-D-erythritol kinase n=1 Tax=Prochlorococcus marinus subsp. pastoris (strain CCMP1986 / NIES-2087 / MED4) TaxID=59919 RepID=ISPE_PROMP|nr:4-(cytidine 5'-diphospho)-2-C-methyl-D-erythritol kinase [Prochlorococcus marinus]Q7V1E2.1 RecName: Full=4-diphosphocytidyl-2-C-methyl-D-erythritol kinase; Short=CMK; AltName: Full=4-(cytidine-5'-diphospho)-2-C-methyl-D-erythritol kinase [Prochlorococcus marinus subsp. pastoris str. CCMP1986]CAE19391.1 Putative 4-diphosphocytidyl-2C-methyl-D-erythritol kinase (CMK) [Prochlorococcus marinus subsp. pastoris str. CCMP1986]